VCTINGFTNQIKQFNKKVYADFLNLLCVSETNLDSFYEKLASSPIEKSVMELSTNIYLFPIQFD
jgi:hypothetical protein